MTDRMNVYTEDGELAGWFDRDKATAYRENSYWDGRNTVGVESRVDIKFVWVGLYRTAGGRWVLRENYHRYMDGGASSTFITDEEARIWLLRNEKHNALQKHFGPIEDEAVL
jgi:hypothetical protein